MKLRILRYRIVAAMCAAGALIICGCDTSTGLRDAAFGGLLDFVAGTMTDSLSALVPLADMIAGT